MGTEIGEKIAIPTKFSAAIIAELSKGPDLRTSKLLLVRNRSTQKWGPPAGHTFLLPNSKLESPQETVMREWREETGNLPLDFSRKPYLYKVLHSYDQLQNIASLGFVFKGLLNDEFAERSFKRSADDILDYKHIQIKGDFETDSVGLFDYHEVMKILANWNERLHRPAQNGDTLLDWCNSIAQTVADYTNSGDWTIKREGLNFDWNISGVFWSQY